MQLKVLSLVLALAGCSRAAPEERARGEPGLLAAGRPEAEVSELAGLQFLELLTGGAVPGERLPLIVAIHGLGDTPANFSALFKGFGGKARIIVPRGRKSHGVRKPLGQVYAWMMPTGREPAVMLDIGESTDRLAGLIEAVTELRPTRGKAVVTGFSQGGVLSFTLASLYPQLIEASVPVGGWLPRFAWPEKRCRGGERPRVRAFNGDVDQLSPQADVRQSITKLGEVGFEAEVRLYKGVAHRITPRMRDDLHATLEEAIGGSRRPSPCEPCQGEPRTCSICVGEGGT